MRTLHPTIKIMSLVLLAISVCQVTAQTLSIFLMAEMLLLLFYGHQDFIKLLKRAKWLLLAMLVIYALTTPGEYIKSWPLELAPTYEGIYHGLMQSMRLIIMLAGLALLNELTSREELIAGFYVLLMPLKCLKLEPERFAARLWLTLYYVEHAAEKASLNAKSRLSERLTQLDAEPEITELIKINLKLAALTWRDGLALFVIIVSVYLLCV